jgi:hypothetical protein
MAHFTGANAIAIIAIIPMAPNKWVIVPANFGINLDHLQHGLAPTPGYKQTELRRSE